MLTLSDLHYETKKNIFYSGIITKPSYNIYYSKHLPCPYWNHAIVSDVVSFGSIEEDIKKDFEKLNRQLCIHIRSHQLSDFLSQYRNRFKISVVESWLRYENKCTLPDGQIHEVSTEKEREDFMKLFIADYNHDFKYGLAVSDECIEAVRSTFDNPKYRHFISYEGDEPAAIGTIGEYQEYFVVFNLVVDERYFDGLHKAHIINACLKHHESKNGKGLSLKINNNNRLEKWYTDNGFKRINTSYYLTA